MKNILKKLIPILWMAFVAMPVAASVSVSNPYGLDTVISVYATTTEAVGVGGGAGDTGCTFDENGNVICDAGITASAFYGDGSALSGITSATPTLQAVTDAGSTTSNGMTAVSMFAPVVAGGADQLNTLSVVPNYAKAIPPSTGTVILYMDEAVGYLGGLNPGVGFNKWGIANNVTNDDLAITYNLNDMLLFSTGTADIMQLGDGDDTWDPVFYVKKTGDVYASGTYYGDGSGLSGITSATPTLDAVVTAGSSASSTIYTTDLVVTGDLHLPLTTGLIYFDAGTDTLSLWGSAGRIESYTPFYNYTAAAAPNFYIENAGTGNGITIAESGGGNGIYANNATSGGVAYLAETGGRGVYAYAPIAAQFDAWGAGSTAILKLVAEDYYGSIGLATDMINGQFQMDEMTGDIFDIDIKRNESMTPALTVSHDAHMALGLGSAIDTSNILFTTSATASVGIRSQVTNDAASGTQMILEHTPPLAAVGDWPGRFIVRSGANDISDVYTQIEDATGASTDTSMHFRVMNDGVLTELFSLNGNGTNTVNMVSDLSVSGNIEGTGYYYGDGSTLTGVVVATSTSITYPSLIFDTDHFNIYGSAMVYNDNVYYQIQGVGGVAWTQYLGYNNSSVLTSANVRPPSYVYSIEPKNITSAVAWATGDYDGTDNLDVLLMTSPSGAKSTSFIGATHTAVVSAYYISAGYTVDKTISDVFIANGATASYTFDLSPITAAGVSLWGGDGIGGERSTVSAGTLNSESITLNKSDTARPTCDTTTRGMIWFTRNDVGSDADALEVCAEDASDVLGWRTLY